MGLHTQVKDESSQQRLMQQLKSDGQILLSALTELKDNVTQFGRKENHCLVSAILNLDWLQRDEAIINQYKVLLINLICAHTFHLKTVLRMLVKKFLFGVGDVQPVHDLISDISRLVPMMSHELIPLLAAGFPFIRREVNTQENYVRNLLAITTYLPSKRQEILDLIINHIIQLDVTIPKQKLSEIEAQLNSEIDEELKIEFQLVVNSANTLDTLMDILLTFIHDSCHSNDELDFDATKKLYSEILMIFNTRILTTHACGHVQFILFYLCSLKDWLCQNALAYLWKKVENPSTPTVIRQMTTTYISSLLTRASFVKIELVVRCIHELSAWIHNYIDCHEGCNVIVDSNIHGTFYSVCQALFHLISTRHAELIAMENGFSYLQSLNLERLITCQLNPLRWCHPGIVYKFASITRYYQLVYCYTVIQRNERSFLPTTNPLGSITIDCVFPFDLYPLKESGSYIRPIYTEYEAEKQELKTESEEDDFLNDMDTSEGKLPDMFGLSPPVY